MAKAYHLGSKQHKVSIQRSEFAQSQKQPDAFSMKNISAAKATENLCLSAQFFTNHYLSANFFDSFCFYLHSIIKNASEDTNQFSSPLGNRHLTKHGYKAAQIACFDAISEKIKQELENTFAPTGAQRKLMISADKGTANKDVTRQAIVCTYVNNDGIPEEALISVAGITDQTATGAAEQLTKECSRLINTKNVIAMCTDGASVYTGVDRGMVEQLRQKNNFSKKLIFLPDFCHKAERLLCKDKPNWVRETISMSTFIVTSINSHSKIATALKNYADVTSSTFYALQGMSTTRYAEYAHIHIQSILKNLDIFLNGLPSVMENTDATGDVASVILKMVSEPVFIGKLILLDSVFVDVAVAEKVAQSKTFGPLTYKLIINELKAKLFAKAKDPLTSFKNFIDSGTLKYTFLSNSKPKCMEVNLKGGEHYSNWKHHKDEFQDLQTSYQQWLSTILEHFDHYLEIPEIVSVIDETFSTEKSLNDRVNALRKVFSLLNIDFKSCSLDCTGFKSCPCLYNQFVNFSKEFDTLPTDNSVAKDVYSKKDYTVRFAYYLSDANHAIMKKRNITNIIRCVEAFQLLKSSQSSTERAMSVVSQHVKGKFEGKYRFGSNVKYDMVAISTFLTMNSSVYSLDKSLARKKFIAAGHHESLLKTKPSSYIGTSMKRLLSHSQDNLVNRKRKRPTIEAVLDNIQTTTSTTNESQYEDVHVAPSVENHEQLTSLNTSPLVDTVIDFDRFCICNGEVRDVKWVGCANKESCKSYMQQKQENNYEHGDWFHLKCTGLKKTPKSKVKWYCQKCKDARPKKIKTKIELLQNDLLKENRRLVPTTGDGNCMYSALALHEYGQASAHVLIRNRISAKLKELFVDPKNAEKWKKGYWLQEPEPNGSVDQLIRKIVLFYNDIINGEDLDEITIEKRLSYIESKQNPATSKDTSFEKLRKYGTSIELEVFSHMSKKDIWILQPITKSNQTIGYKWHLSMKNRSSDDFCTLMYEFKSNTDLSHYTGIITNNPKENVERPVDQVIYDYSTSNA